MPAEVHVLLLLLLLLLLIIFNYTNGLTGTGREMVQPSYTNSMRPTRQIVAVRIRNDHRDGTWTLVDARYTLISHSQRQK